MISRIRNFNSKVMLLATLITAMPMSAAASLSMADKPLFLVSIPPIVMVMLDNSGSMKNPMFSGGFSSTTTYHGIFDSAKAYQYDATIPVNSAAYGVTVTTTSPGAFVEAGCTPSAVDTTCWDGNYLNWLTTRRIDSSRVVLVGGKLESETAYNYGTDSNGDTLQYKIVANNEWGDKDIVKAYASSSSYSPLVDGVSVDISSTATWNAGSVLSQYDPYAKILSNSGFVYNSAGAVIGEFGFVQTDENEHTISLAHTFSTPIAVAKSATIKGGDPGVVRITQNNGTQLKLYFQEWDYKDGGHTDEVIPYLVLEQGLHTLPGGKKIRAGKVSTNKMYVNDCGVSVTQSVSVNFTAGFISTPVVMHSVMTKNGGSAVNSRVWDVTSSGMKISMQEEEDLAGGGHATEDLGYIAIEPGTVSDATLNMDMKMGLVSNVTSSNKAFSFSSSFTNTPVFLSAIQTLNEGDTAALRVNSYDTSGAAVRVQEEKSCDNEEAHGNEKVGYIALGGVSGGLNLALAVVNKPSGLLQSIEDKVRLGVSFYRFDPASNDIYNSEKTDGGTLNFKIPKNPFVKKPSDTALPAAERGYRELSGYVGTNLDDIVDAIQHYPLVWGTTPLAENLFEVIQYFEQDSPHYTEVETGFPDFELADTDGDGVYEDATRDPFYYPAYSSALECASPSVIIFTDGEPYRDAAIPAALQDYDSDSDADDVADSVNENTHGADNLDDVAFWGFCNTASANACPDSDADGDIDSDDNGSRDLRADLDGDQALRAYSVAFAGSNIASVLQDTADNAGGRAYAAADGASLASALTEAFTDAISASSASAVSVDTGSITSNTKLYQAKFDGTNWTGDVLAYAIASDGTIGGTPDWQASSVLPAYTARQIFTHDGSSGIAFSWTDLTAGQKALLSNDSTVLDYLKGDQTNENNVSGFRVRSRVLGDIVHSSPIFVGDPSSPYPDNWNGAVSEAEDSVGYSSFVGSVSRVPVVYAGANDGMLHAFHATTGVELFAYVPNELFPQLEILSSPSYAHNYYVDASPTVLDAFYSNAWHSVLLGGLGAGGQGIFALDVTDPATFSASDVLWEFSDDDDADLGYTLGRPNVVRMQSGTANTKWAGVFGNGYDNTQADGTVSTTGHAVLYIVDVSDGTLIKKIDTGIGSVANPNGLSSAAPVDIDGDFIVDYIYAGDLYGNMWKFDVSNTDKTQWGVAFSGSPLFTACNGPDCTNPAYARQPVTSRPQVGRHPTGKGVMVYFGTGKYFEVGDDAPTGQPNQTFYGVWDRGDDHQAYDRDHLLEQEIIKEVEVLGTDNTSSSDDFDYRLVTGNSVEWHTSTTSLPAGSPITTHLGWYLDLYNTESGNTTNYGEKQVSDPVLRGDRIIFTTLIPSSSPCAAGGTGWLMELATLNGGQLTYTPFDVNNDGTFDTDDYLPVDLDGDGVDEYIPVSGKKSKVGIIQKPGIVSIPDERKEIKYNSGSTGDIQTTAENPGYGDASRQSWRQLF